MIDQLEQSEEVESESKQSLLQNLEAKILALQTQLRTLRDQQADRSAEASAALPAPQSQGYGYQGNNYQGYQPGYQGGYQGQNPYGGRGRGRGRFPPARGFVRGGRGGRFRGGRAGGRGRFGGRNNTYYDDGTGGDGGGEGGGITAEQASAFLDRHTDQVASEASHC